MATKSGRQHCRICGALAGITRDVCDGCRMAEVRSHITHRKGGAALTQAVGGDVQDAYADSLVSLPVTGTRGPREAVLGHNQVGVREGLRPGDKLGVEQVLANAAHFAATLTLIPMSQSAAEVFYSASRRHFYNHVRNLCRALDLTRRPIGSPADAPLRTRKNTKGKTKYACTPINQALAKALRWTRIYMQVEMVPLALRINCSKTQIWHLESGNNVVMAKWVKSYAEALHVSEAGLWAFADALEPTIHKPNDAQAMLRLFVDLVLDRTEAPRIALA